MSTTLDENGRPLPRVRPSSKKAWSLRRRAKAFILVKMIQGKKEHYVDRGGWVYLPPTDLNRPYRLEKVERILDAEKRPVGQAG